AVVFFFQAEDGIRDATVTGVQTCALPILAGGGIAGLTMACALAQRGWSVTLHERNSELREMGAALYLKVNSLTVLKELGALDARSEERRVGKECTSRWGAGSHRKRRV